MKSLAVFALKGGVGKSTIAANLAFAAAGSGGRRTLLWDLDSQGAAGYLLGADRPAQSRARDAVASGGSELATLVLPTAHPGLQLLPADRSLRRLEGDLAQSDKGKILKKLLKSLEPGHDRVIIDSPPGLSELADRLFRAVDLLVVPLIPSPLSGRTLDQLRAELARLPGNGPALLPVWNMVDRRRRLHRETVEAAPDWPQIPHAALIEASAVARKPLALVQPVSPAARAFASLWTSVEMALLKGWRAAG